jgi:hypothetical protein
MNPIARLQAKYPHQVILSDWFVRPSHRKKTMITNAPASWNTMPDARIFGFKTAQEADDFQVRFGGDRVRL